MDEIRKFVGQPVEGIEYLEFENHRQQYYSVSERDMITWLTSNFLVSSAKVCWPFTTSKATLAMKTGENFLLVCFFIIA